MAFNDVGPNVVAIAIESCHLYWTITNNISQQIHGTFRETHYTKTQAKKSVDLENSWATTSTLLDHSFCHSFCHSFFLINIYHIFALSRGYLFENVSYIMWQDVIYAPVPAICQLPSSVSRLPFAFCQWRIKIR